MNVAGFLASLNKLDIRLSLSGDRLSCDAPQGVLTPDLLEEISARKPEIIEFIRLAQGASAYPPLQKLPGSGRLPLSPGQERIWSLANLAPGSPAYNMYLAFEIAGPLDAGALGQAIGAVIQRHEVLRTCYQEERGQVYGILQPWQGYPLQVESLPSDAGSPAELEVLAREEAARPFELHGCPLFRARLFQRRTGGYLLTLVMHHLVSDGWSWEILLNELSAAYSAFCRGAPPPLPGLPVQYADYAAWQWAWMESQAFAGQVDFWRRNLAGYRGLNLPFRTGTPAGRTDQGARQALPFSPEISSMARGFARQHGATLFATLLAANQALLYFWSRQDDILVLSPSASRPLRELQNLIGYFNNLIPLRTQLSGDMSFADLLQAVKAGSQAAFENADVPFDRVASLPEVVRVPLTRAVFSVQDPSASTLVLPGLSVSNLEVYNGTAGFDLFFSVRDRGDRLESVLEYRTELLASEQAAALLLHYRELLSLALTRPEQRLDELCSQLPGMHQLSLAAPPQNGNTHTKERKPPASPLETQLCRMWEEALGAGPMGVTDNFFELGGHSLLALHLFGRIERELGRNLPLAELVQNPTVEHLARLIEEGAEKINWSSLVPIQPLGARPPFFGVHALEGNILFWRHIVRNLDADQPFYALQARGVDGFSDPPGSIPEIARSYLEEIQQVQGRGPYYLGGYSLGGEIAFEMAQQLISRGEEVALLVLFDTSNPNRPVRSQPLPQAPIHTARHTTPPGPGVMRRKVQRHLHRLKSRNVLGMLQYLWKEISWRSHQTFVRAAVRSYRFRRKRLPPSLLVENLSQRLVKALDAYDPQVYPGRIVLFRAKSSLEQNPLEDPLGWAPLAGGGLHLHLFESSHNILSPQFAQDVGRQLMECIRDADRRRRPEPAGVITPGGKRGSDEDVLSGN